MEKEKSVEQEVVKESAISATHPPRRQESKPRSPTQGRSNETVKREPAVDDSDLLGLVPSAQLPFLHDM